ncbi:MAG: hypothetical protein R3F60_06680 [bacterium]
MPHQQGLGRLPHHILELGQGVRCRDDLLALVARQQGPDRPSNLLIRREISRSVQARKAALWVPLGAPKSRHAEVGKKWKP